MRILIVTTFFPPLNSIASLRPYSWAKYWGRAGHDVTVLTTAKEPTSTMDLILPMESFKVREAPLPKIFSMCKKNYLQCNKSQPGNPHNLNTSIQYCKQKIFSLFDTIRNTKGILNSCRMPDITDFWVRPALNEIQNDPPWDLVISTAGPYTTHIVASAIKKRGQAKQWIADYRDKWSDSIIYPGIFPFNLIEKALEKRLITHVNAITTISKPFAETYATKFPNTKVIAIENGFDPCDLEHIDPNPIFPSDEKFRIVYTGSFYPGKQNPSSLFKAIIAMNLDPKLQNLLDKLEILFVGPTNKHLQILIKDFGITQWVKLQEPVNRQDALRMQRDAHLLLFLPWDDQTVDGVFTGKLFEYLFSKTPILSIGSKEIETSQRLILEAKAGTPHNHAEEITTFLTKHLRFPSKKKNSIDPNILNRYNRQFLAMKLLKYVEK